MVTNLKRSKKVRAFCYRMIATAALITAICTAVMGREALVDAYYYGLKVFSGSIYDSPEFRAYIAELYNKAMNGYAGIGDDNGYPLTDSHAAEYSEQAKSDFERMLKSLGDDIVYYISMPGLVGENGMEITEMSNVSYPIFSEYDGHLLLPEDVMLCCSWDGEKQSLTFFDQSGSKSAPYRYYNAQYKPNEEGARQIKLVLAVKKDCQQYTFDIMEYKAVRYQEIFVTLLVSVITWLVFGMIGLVSGRAARTAKEEFGAWSGKVFLEIKLVLVVAAICVIAFFGLYTLGYDMLTRMKTYDSLWLYFLLGCLIYLFYIDVKQNQTRILLSSLPVKGVCGIAEIVRRKPWYRRASVLCIGMLIGGILLVVGGIGLSVLSRNIPLYIYKKFMLQWMFVCGILMILAGAWLLYGYFRQSKLLKDTSAIVDKLEEVTNGRTGTPLVVSKHSMLENAAKDLNELENGIEKAVEQQNRSNKMRVELLTNVSHDLKTPLTSIINYADLLCEEELPETAAEYATALQGKAYRLKNMVQDVFDLSKATSGNLNVEPATIDLVKLIKQTLADMDERIQESNLVFKLNITNEPLLIEADGEKLYRVFQNLFVNALQYSLDHSRVHIQLLEEEGFAVARVKNTSRMELNFDPDEIVERFVRADSSRTTEGSGLGLSIVQSFVEACGGQFKIETDADMFTASVRFPLSQKPVVVEPVEFEENL